MNFTELFDYCKRNKADISVRCHETEYDTEYYLRLRRGDTIVRQVFDESSLKLLKDPDQMVNSRIAELINELNEKNKV